MIKNYSASADTTITNSFKPDLLNRGTGSNMGAADVLEVFSIFHSWYSSYDSIVHTSAVPVERETLKSGRDDG